MSDQLPDISEADKRWLADQTGQVILAAVDGHGERATDLLIEVAERYGGHGVYLLCCALASAIKRMGGFPSRRGDQFWGFVTEHVDRGIIAPEEANDAAQEMMSAMRFLIAYLNDDTEQKLALFHATPATAVLLPCGLIKLAGAYGRAKLARGGGRG